MELFNKHTGAQGHARGGEDLPRRAVCCVGAEAHLPPRAGKAGRGQTIQGLVTTKDLSLS